MPDAEVGHILTNLFSGTPAPPPSHDTQTLTPASSAPTPSQNQNLPPISPSGSQTIGNFQNQSAVGGNAQKRSRSRPTKSCEECRRKKLKCDRELPCSNCKKGGRDGSTCFFKDGTSDGRAEKRVRIDEGLGMGRQERPIDREKYPNLPSFVRSEGMAGPGKGLLAYGMNDVHVNDAGPGRGVLAFGVRDVAPTPTPAVARAWSTGQENETLAPMLMWSGYGRQDENARALGRVHVKGKRSRYVGIGDRMAMLDHVG
jgi:Fungal Zn(2)-Cys(6) binuclear cluster domain